ncbi:AbiTii domain-containing protein [Bosea sp. (in: a-proteobacteria)]|jgi:hypothetical protein|uniref:AbiTii domain-containing protein n=1 Tax=Bosea sp. (in: a-proteobacteria) TaxID=1871050 RepID=UPI004034EFEA
MSGLIIEIQRAALEPEVRVEDLLRRVKLAAAKLKLGDLEEWVTSELNGYKAHVPDYRRIRGQAKAWNPYNGWIPIIFGDDRVDDIINQVNIGQSISSLRDLVTESESGTLQFPMTPAMINMINEHSEIAFGTMAVMLGRSSIVDIVDIVRTKVLDWSIAMEERGIIGEGLTFGAEEQKKAQAAMTTFNIGTIGNFAGNMGSGNRSGNVQLSVSLVASIQQASTKIRASLPELVAQGADSAVLQRALDAIDEEAGQPEPNPAKLRDLWSDARAALSGAAGSLLAEGAIAVIDPIIKLLGG